MATTKKSIVKSKSNRITKQAAAVPTAPMKIWNQGKRDYQIDVADVVKGGVETTYSKDKKYVTVRAGERCTVTRECGERLSKNYPSEIIILE
jgi:hypothetical protein